MKDKWSWGGMFFGVGWAIYHRLWGVVIFMISLYGAAVLSQKLPISPDIKEIISGVLVFAILGSVFVFGKQGNTWKRKKIEKAKFKEH